MGENQQSLHRCRFFTCVPSAITSISTTGDNRYVAVARENGDVEIFDAREDLLSIQMIPTDQSVTTNASIYRDTNSTTRILIAGASPSFSVLPLGAPISEAVVTPTHGGPVHISVINEEAGLVALACADCAVRVFSVADPTSPPVLAATIVAGAAITALAWAPSAFVHGLHGAGTAPVLLAVGTVAGEAVVADLSAAGEGARAASTVARWRVSGSAQRTVAATATAWLSNGELAVGTSAGSLHVFDAAHSYSETVVFRPMTTPVTSIATTSNGASMFITGVHPTVHLYARSPAWVFVRSHTAHSHDVRAAVCLTVDLPAASGVRGTYRNVAESHIAGTERHRSYMDRVAGAGRSVATGTLPTPLLLTGGVDGNLIVWATDMFTTRRPSCRVSCVGRPAFAPAAAARTVASAVPGAVQLWTMPEDDQGEPILALSLRSREFGRVRALALADDGRLLVVAAGSTTRIYTVDLDEGVERVADLPQASSVHAISHGDGHLVVVGNHAGVVSVLHAPAEGDLTEIATFSLPPGSGHVASLDIDDGASMVLARAGNGTVVLFSLDSTSLLPPALAPPTTAAAAAFLPTHVAAAAGAAAGAVLVFDAANHARVWCPTAGAWAGWNSAGAAHPAWLHERAPDHVHSISFSATEPLAVVAGTSFLTGLRLDRPPSTESESLYADNASNYRRVRGLDRVAGAVIWGNDIFVGEITDASMLKHLPPAAHRRRFAKG